MVIGSNLHLNFLQSTTFIWQIFGKYLKSKFLFCFFVWQICTSGQTHLFSSFFLYINANPNLYFGSNPWFFCLIPFFIIGNPNLYFGWNPQFLCLILLSIFKQIQICTSALTHHFSANFLKPIQICTSTQSHDFSAYLLHTSKEFQICTLGLTHHFYAHFLHWYSSKFKSILWVNPMIFL